MKNLLVHLALLLIATGCWSEIGTPSMDPRECAEDCPVPQEAIGIASVVPVGNSALAGESPITITFNSSTAGRQQEISFQGLGEGAVRQWTTGSVRLTPLSHWPEGTHGLVIDIKHPVNDSVASAIYTYSIDTTAPQVSLDIPGGPLSPSRVFTIQFSEAVAPDSLELGGSLGDSGIQPLWPAPDRLQLSPQGQWQDGSQTLTVVAKDTVGNVGATGSWSFLIDAQAPRLLTMSPADGRLGATSPLTLSFSEALAPGARVEGVTSAQVESEGPSTLVLTPSGAWPHGDGQEILVAVADSLGNATSIPVTVDVDARGPVLSFRPVPSSPINGSSQVTVAADEPIGPQVVITGTMANEALSPVVGQTSVLLTPKSVWTHGSATVGITVSDLFGNSTTQGWTYGVDARGPRLIEANWRTPDGTETPAGTGATVHASHSLCLSFDEVLGEHGFTGPNSVEAVEHPAGNRLCVSPASQWSEGDFRITAVVEDALGNPATPVTVEAKIVGNALFVDGVGGSDLNPGNRFEPKQTVQAAIEAAVELLPLGRGIIYVGAGEYGNADRIVVPHGVELRGASWNDSGATPLGGESRPIFTRTGGQLGQSRTHPEPVFEVVGNGSVLKDLIVSVPAGFAQTGVWVRGNEAIIERITVRNVSGDAGVGILTTEVDGFTLAGSTIVACGDAERGVLVRNSTGVTLRGTTVTLYNTADRPQCSGEQTQSDTDRWALVLYRSDVQVERSRILGQAKAFAIHTQAAHNVDVENTVIGPYGAGTESLAIFGPGTVRVAFSTIRGPIRQPTADTILVGNLIVNSGNSTQHCLAHTDSAIAPRIESNVFAANCSYKLAEPGVQRDVGALNLQLGFAANNREMNLNLDPNLIPTPQAPCASVRSAEERINSQAPPIDRRKVTRTNPVSYGAFESDGTCL